MNTENTTKTAAAVGASAGLPPSHAALPRGSLLQEFEVTGVIGEGGFGIVYLAQDRQLQRTVAIKEYMPASLASRGEGSSVVVRSDRYQDTFSAGLSSFIAEARMLAQFKHPALVEVFRFWEQNGTVYMAMPFYQGKTLREALKGEAAVDERWLKTLLGPLMEALEMLHEQSVYHRDIAPDNIMVLASGAPVLLDLGAARRVIADLTQAVTVVLKPGYAPIEQYAEDMCVQLGPWTDIYALAAVAYFAIVGRAPVASVSRIMKDSLQPLRGEDHPGFSEAFLVAINRALAVRPEDRPQSIAEFRKSLGAESFAVPTTMFPYKGGTDPAARRLDPVTVTNKAPSLRLDKPLAQLTPELRSALVPGCAELAPDSTVRPASATPGNDSSGGAEGAIASSGRIRPRRRVWLAGATGVVLVGVGSVLLGSLLPDAAGIPPVAQSAPPVPSAQSFAATQPPFAQAVPVEPGSAQSRLEEEAHEEEPASKGDKTAATGQNANDEPSHEMAAVQAAVRLKVVLQPWGEVWVDGVSRGPSPPLKELMLPEGGHIVELRNPGFNSLTRKLTLKKGEPIVIEHHFQ
jgi:serine/threonine protein kinase